MKKLFYHSNKRKERDGDAEQQPDTQSKRKRRSSKEKIPKITSKHDISSEAMASDEELAGSDGVTGSIRGLNDLEKKIWTKSTNEEEQTREQEINKYLKDLLM